MKLDYSLGAILAAMLFLGGCAQEGTAKNDALSGTLPSPNNTAINLTKPLDLQKNENRTDQPTIEKSMNHSDSIMNKKVVIDWSKPSGGPYPKLSKDEKIWLSVSIKEQRVYIKEGDEVIYKMVMSSGLNHTTPEGTYYIQSERGTWFYNKRLHEGAEYWVSWKNHGKYLFHTIPMTENKSVIVDEAKKLGTKASHGCFRLTIADAKWIFDNIPVKTKVVIA